MGHRAFAFADPGSQIQEVDVKDAPSSWLGWWGAREVLVTMSADITPEQWAEAEKTAPTFTDVVVGDSAEAWRAAGFAVEVGHASSAAEIGVCTLGGVRFHLVGSATPGVHSWTIESAGASASELEINGLRCLVRPEGAGGPPRPTLCPPKRRHCAQQGGDPVRRHPGHGGQAADRRAAGAQDQPRAPRE